MNVIDNKRLFVVQSRGELREGSERQVFLWKKMMMTMMAMMTMAMIMTTFCDI